MRELPRAWRPLHRALSHAQTQTRNITFQFVNQNLTRMDL